MQSSAKEIMKPTGPRGTSILLLFLLFAMIVLAPFFWSLVEHGILK